MHISIFYRLYDYIQPITVLIYSIFWTRKCTDQSKVSTKFKTVWPTWPNLDLLIKYRKQESD